MFFASLTIELILNYLIVYPLFLKYVSAKDVMHPQIINLIILKYLFSVNLYFFVSNISIRGHTRDTL